TAGLPFVASTLIWAAIGVAIMVLGIGWLRPERPARALLWSLTFYPVFAAVSFGQNSLLSLGIFAGVYRLLVGERKFAAGLVAGLLWFKPQLLIGLFIWWLVAPRRYAGCWAGVAVTGAILAAISWIALPEASWAFVDSLQANLAYGGEAGWNKQSPRAFWFLLLPEASSLVIGLLTLASTLPFIAAAMWLAWRTGAPVASMFPVAIFLSLWVSPHTLIYEWALLVPAAIVLWERFPERRDAWLCMFVAAWLALVSSTPLTKALIDYAESRIVVQFSVPVMGAIGWIAMRILAATPRPAMAKV